MRAFIRLSDFIRPRVVRDARRVILDDHMLQLMRPIVLKSFLESLILGFAAVAVTGLVAMPNAETSHEAR
jgi:hypothetical protein